MGDPQEYLRAGYVAQAGCTLQSALEYVAWQEGYPTFVRDARIWFKVDGLEVPTPYYWESDLLLKRTQS